MDHLFLFQLIASFLVGGGLIALQSFLAERASPNVAGFFLSIPSTQAIALFFLGWIAGPESVAEVFPVIPASLGASILYVALYVYFSRVVSYRLLGMILGIGLSISVWLLLAAPLAIYELQNVWLSLGIFLLLAGVSHYFLAVRPKLPAEPVLLRYTWKQKLLRSIFAGCVVAVTVICTKLLGPFWGGIFSMYPAAYTSNLLIIHYYYDPEILFRVTRKVPVGSITFILYGLVASIAFPLYGIAWGTVVAYVITIPGLMLLARMQSGGVRRKR